MSKKDALRIAVIERVVTGKMTAKQAAEAQVVSVRQVRRQIRAFQEKGVEGLIHGNRGRISSRRLPEAIREQVSVLMREKYSDYNTSHARDELEWQERINISYATLYRLRRELSQGSPRRHRGMAHRRRRERAARRGQLVQADGSLHRWLEGRGPELALIAFIDDASGQILGATFREQEDTVGYLRVLHAICRREGVPQSLYTDRHNIFQSPKRATLEQKLRGEEPRSHFGRALAQLGIVHIPAQSPQAKGRVERLFGTLQDRLVKELRQHNASTLAEANRVLQQYLPKFNQRFARPPADPEPAFSPWPEGLSARHVFACHYRRVVANDNTISFGGLRLPIPPGPQRRSYVRVQVDVYLHYSGTLTIEYQGLRLASFAHDRHTPVRVDHFTPARPIRYAPTPPPAPPEPPAPKTKVPVRPAADHPWRKSFKSGPPPG